MTVLVIIVVMLEIVDVVEVKDAAGFTLRLHGFPSDALTLITASPLIGANSKRYNLKFITLIEWYNKNQAARNFPAAFLLYYVCYFPLSP